MSQFLHTREYLDSGNVAVLDCDTQCNFMLLTDSNFNNYKRGGRYQYYGGYFKIFPAKISAPHSDHWNVVIDLGGGSATIKHSLRFLK
jgi:hypothetical protein